MIRLFSQHEIRPQKELCGLWNFQKAGSEKTYQIPVPGCWEQNPELVTYRGKGTFRKTLNLTHEANLRLEFKGASHTADVYLDGVKIAHHYNAYTSFGAIAKHVQKGAHELTVEVDNSFSEASALHVPNDYYTYGGFNRTVVMEEVADTFIENIHFTPHKAADDWGGTAELWVRNLTDTPKSVTLHLSLAGAEADIPAILAPEAVTKVTTTLDCPGAEEWFALAPKLYDLTARLYGTQESPDTKDTPSAPADDGGSTPDISANATPLDDLIDRVGFREIKIDGRKILLNGKPIFLKGFNRHEDYGPFGAAVPFQAMVQDIDMMMEMGSNAVRTCHYPNDELFLDLCDEKGLLVWEEIHSRGLTLEQMQNPNFDRQAEDCTREMIEQHFNHPAIVIWAIFNECASDTKEGAAKYRPRFEQIRTLDNSRPVTSASCKHFKDLTLNMQDIVSINLYSGWYDDKDPLARHNEELDWVERTVGTARPIIMSEFGGGAMYGYRDRGHCKWSEERQADILRQLLEIYRDDDRISGAFIWQFADCRVTEEGWWEKRSRCHNNKGVVDEYRRPKEAYDLVEEIFPTISR